MNTWQKLSEVLEQAEDRVLETLSPQIAKIRLTKTMIEKYIIDAKADTQKLSLIFGVNYDDLEPGQGVTVPAMWTAYQFASGATAREAEESQIRFYKTKRGDKRISIKGIRSCHVGDLISLSYQLRNGEAIISATITNVSAMAETELAKRPKKINLGSGLVYVGSAS